MNVTNRPLANPGLLRFINLDIINRRMNNDIVKFERNFEVITIFVQRIGEAPGNWPVFTNQTLTL